MSQATHLIPLLDFLFGEGTRPRAVYGANGNADSNKTPDTGFEQLLKL